MVILAKVELIQGLLPIDLHVTFEPVNPLTADFYPKNGATLCTFFGKKLQMRSDEITSN